MPLHRPPAVAAAPLALAAVLALQAPLLAPCARTKAEGLGWEGPAVAESGGRHGDPQELDTAGAEAALRWEHPGILREGERMLLAVGVGQGKNYFTGLRVILESWSQGEQTFQTIPYESVKAFRSQTRGVWPKLTTSLELYTSLPSLPKVAAGFRASNATSMVNIYEVDRLLSKQVLGLEVPKLQGVESLLQASSGASASGRELCSRDGAWPALVLDHSPSRIDARACERELQRSAALLGGSEKVLMAFNHGHSTLLLTSRRIVILDVSGVFEKVRESLTVPYEAVEAFQVETAGRFTPLSKIRIWTSVPSHQLVELALRAEKEDLQGIQGVLSDKTAGAQHAAVGQPEAKSHPRSIREWLLASSGRADIDPQDADRTVRGHGMLQAEGAEHVLIAFGVGPDTVMLLTNKRLLMIRSVGMDAVQYKTIPYRAVRAYSVQTGGLHPELKIWTGVARGDGDEDMSSVRLELKTERGSMHEYLRHHEIQELLSTLVLGYTCCPRESRSLLSTFLLSDFYRYLANETEHMALEKVEDEFKRARILHGGESVHMAFRRGRSLHVGTSKRFLLVDRERGRESRFQSIPYASVAAFKVSSAGFSDDRFELTASTDMPGLPRFQQTVRGARASLDEAIMRAGMASRTPGTSPGALLQEAVPPGNFFNFYEMFQPWRQPPAASGCGIGAKEANKEFRAEKPLLLPDETVMFACRASGALTLLTNMRAVRVAEQGPRVSYESIPYSSVGSYAVDIADAMTNMELYVTSASDPTFEQKFARYTVNIFDVSAILTSGVVARLGRRAASL